MTRPIGKKKKKKVREKEKRSKEKNWQGKSHTYRCYSNSAVLGFGFGDALKYPQSIQAPLWAWGCSQRPPKVFKSRHP
jgi:hypothetical protein